MIPFLSMTDRKVPEKSPLLMQWDNLPCKKTPKPLRVLKPHEDKYPEKGPGLFPRKPFVLKGQKKRISMIRDPNLHLRTTCQQGLSYVKEGSLNQWLSN